MPDFSLAPDARVDLHMHTIYSDGHWQPAKLFDYLAAEHFQAVAVTDHDTVSHLDELRLLGEARGLVVLAGVEVTSRWRGMTAHILCYARQFEGDALATLVAQTSQLQLENTFAVYRELERRSYRFPQRDEVLAAQHGQLLRPIDNARLLVAHGQVSQLSEALEMLRDAGYVIIAAPIEATVAAAQASGAVTILAHPGRGGGEIQRYDPPAIEELLQDAPLDGIEVYYPTHNEQQTGAYQDLAERHHLLMSAGSDSHGPRQRFPIAYRAEQCATLLTHCGLRLDS